MGYNIAWTFFLKVTTPRKCERLLDKIAQLLELELSNVNAERYWKDETLFKVSARSNFSAATQSDGLYALMTHLSRLGRSWFIGGSEENQPLAIMGTTKEEFIRISGIQLVTFECSSEIAVSVRKSPVFEGSLAGDAANLKT